MESRKKKAINFDLDTNRMKELGLYPDGYRQLGNSLHKQGFTHRQGSGYVSEAKLTSNDINNAMLNVVNDNPWLADCAKKVDVTDIGRQHDLTAIIQGFASQKNADSPLKKRNKENTKKGLLQRDEELIQRISKSKRGAEFNRLYGGQYDGSKTVADKKLINILSFFSNGNAAQTERIFKSSKIYNAAKGEKYLTDMVTEVIKHSNDFVHEAKSAANGRQSTAGSSSGAAR